MYKKLVTKTMTTSAILSCSLCKSRKWEIKMKAINILLREKKDFISKDIQNLQPGFHETQLTKLAELLHLVLKMLFLVLISLLKNATFYQWEW